ncbi:UNVERIFIED_CONTAM: hypothetical protein NCL1_07512 [Trichonephila clavipes]
MVGCKVDSGQELFPLPERRQPLRNGDARQGPYLPPALLHVRLLQRAPHAGGHLRAAGQLRLLPLPLRHDNAGVPLLPAANGGVRRTLRPRRAARHRLGEERQAAEEEERRPRCPDRVEVLCVSNTTGLTVTDRDPRNSSWISARLQPCR